MKHRATTSLALSLVFLAAALPVWAGDNKKSDVNDIGNRRVAHRSLISEEKEIAIGKEYASQIDKTAKILKDPVINEYVNRVAQNLARNSDLKVPLTVKVIDDPTINAMALPGGFLYVNSGLILNADEESQIAGVMAHEIAHVAARHWASTMTKSEILQFAMIPLMFTPMTMGVYYGVMEAYMNGVPMAFLHFQRGQEAEADYLGLQYLYKSGYDPQTYVSIFSKVLNAERREPGSVPKIFMDHPPSPDRIVKLEVQMKTFPKKDQYLVSTSEFDDVKSRMEMLISNRRLAQKKEGSPTLRKRQQTEDSTTTTTQQGDKTQTEDDKPPVLKRRDSTGP
jgi:predicted Zn-dependent protease